MAYSYTQHDYTEGVTDYDLVFSGGYRSRDQISVIRIASEAKPFPADVPFTWLDTYRIRIDPTELEVPDQIRILRTVSKTIPPVNLTEAGSLTRESVQAVTEHSLMVCQELMDGRIDDWSMLEGFTEGLQDIVTLVENAVGTAEEAKDLVVASVQLADQYRQQSAEAAGAAEDYRNQASTFRTQAQTASNNANTQASAAEIARAAAESARADVATDLAAVQALRTAVGTDRTVVANDKAAVASDRAAAVAAAAQAENDAATAVGARTGAESARNTANTHRTAAETARTNAEAANTAAQGAKTDAQQSATSADNHRVSAANSATTANTQRSLAQSARDAADQHRADAQTARDQAQTARTDAQTARTQAQTANSEAAARAVEARKRAGVLFPETINSDFYRHGLHGIPYAQGLSGVTVNDGYVSYAPLSYNIHLVSQEALAWVPGRKIKVSVTARGVGGASDRIKVLLVPLNDAYAAEGGNIEGVLPVFPVGPGWTTHSFEYTMGINAASHVRIGAYIDDSGSGGQVSAVDIKAIKIEQIPDISSALAGTVNMTTNTSFFGGDTVRIPGRVFIGDSAPMTDQPNGAPNSVRSWLKDVPTSDGLGSSWFEVSAKLALTTQYGIAITGASRTPGSASSNTSVFGTASLAWNRGLPSTTLLSRAWGSYIEAYNAPDAGKNVDHTHCFEFAVINKDPNVPIPPMNPFSTYNKGETYGGTINSGINAGAPGNPVRWGLRFCTVGQYNASDVANSNGFMTGILFRANTLLPWPDGRKRAIVMERLDNLSWWGGTGPANAFEAYQQEVTVNTATSAQKQVVHNTGVTFQNANNNPYLYINNASGVAEPNYISLVAQGGSSARVAAGGPGTNIDLELRPKGSGRIVIDLNNLISYGSDAGAAAGGVPIGGLYRSGSDIKVRIA